MPADDPLHSSQFFDLCLFEYYVMPLKQIPLEDFDRRIKKFAFKDESGNDVVKISQLIAAFQDSKEVTEQLRDQKSILH